MMSVTEKRFRGFVLIVSAGLAATYSSTRLSGSTIGAAGFHGRVRDGIGCWDLRYNHQAGKNNRNEEGERESVDDVYVWGCVQIF